MNTTTHPRKFSVLATALAILITVGLSVRPAQAGYIVTLQQVGPNVVATGAGALDFTGLAPFNIFISPPAARIIPHQGYVWTGATATIPDSYQGGASGASWTGPTKFGSSSIGMFATSSTGDFVGVIGTFGGYLIVPTGYVSGAPLSDSAIYSGQDFKSLHVDRGTYVWSWGSGVNQNFTLQIGPVGAVPDSGSSLGLLLVSLAALIVVSRFRSLRTA